MNIDTTPNIPRIRAVAREQITCLGLCNIALKAYLRFVFRLWSVAFIFCLLFSALKGLGDSKSIDEDDGDSEMAIGLKVINTQQRYAPVFAIPALFGKKMKETLFFPLLILENEDACKSFSVNMTRFIQGKFKEKDTNFENFMVMLPRGECPFDVKAHEAEMAGFIGVIIYNNQSRDMDTPIRMAPHSYAGSISIFSMYLTYADASILIASTKTIQYSPMNTLIPIIKLSPEFMGFFSSSKGWEYLWFDMIILFFTVLISVSLALLVCLCSALIKNLWNHRELRLFDTVLNGCRLLLDVRQEDITPKLNVIPFPEKVLDERDIQEIQRKESNVFWGEKCSICLESYEICHKVRILPCQHMFHCECVDPWLTTCNRLCPICKQDVLSFDQEPEEPSPIHSNVQERSLLIPHERIIGWIQRGLMIQNDDESESRLNQDFP